MHWSFSCCPLHCKNLTYLKSHHPSIKALAILCRDVSYCLVCSHTKLKGYLQYNNNLGVFLRKVKKPRRKHKENRSKEKIQGRKQHKQVALRWTILAIYKLKFLLYFEKLKKKKTHIFINYTNIPEVSWITTRSYSFIS